LTPTMLAHSLQVHASHSFRSDPMDATRAVLSVGEGRGFVVALYTQHPDLLDKTVITAAHCLPYAQE
jgi:hypothetical protein